MKTAIIDTIPRDARNQGSINLGLEIVAERLSADKHHWTDRLQKSYDVIAFNVFYPMHLLNIAPFLRNNNIEPLRSLRQERPRLIAGGVGCGDCHILSEIVDRTYTGEYDLDENQKEVTSAPRIKNGKAVIELTRGCKYRCSFCEYAFLCGRYREKPIALVKKQVDWVRGKGVKAINFLSANYAGYRDLDELIDYTKKNGVRLLNSDVCVTDGPRLIPHLRVLPRYMKLGVESFDEKTRHTVRKRITDDDLETLIRKLLTAASGLHFYLIYGLPGDNYDAWFEWLERLGRIRRELTLDQTSLFGGVDRVNTKNVRFEFSLTNFEPCNSTPLEQAPYVDFEKKADFLSNWIEALVVNGFRKKRDGKVIDYVNARGRFGRKELSYRMLMALKNGGPEITDELLYALPNGVGRSVSDREAGAFLAFTPNETLAEVG